jgi:NADH:ubiquinone oxidoreductase subunit 6 (subunit J)
MLGTAGLVLAAGRIVPVEVMTPEAVLFYAFSAIALVSGTLLITVQNPARAALSFTLVVLSTCGLFLLLAAPFLMAATIIIYAGAIVVTFLFVIMLAQQEGPSDADSRSREPLFAAVTGFVLLGAILFVLDKSHATDDVDQLVERTVEARNAETSDGILVLVGPEDKLFQDYRRTLLDRDMKDLSDRIDDTIYLDWLTVPREEPPEKMRDLLGKLEAIGNEAQIRARERAGIVHLDSTKERPLSNLSGTKPDVPQDQVRRDREGRPQLPAENTAYLGKSLFTDYLLPVELAGLLLLVAVIGAIAISHRPPEEGRSR